MVETLDPNSLGGMDLRQNIGSFAHTDLSGELHYHINDHLGNTRLVYKAEVCNTCSTSCVVNYQIEGITNVNAWINVGKVGVDITFIALEANPIVFGASLIYGIADVSGWLEW